MIAGTLALLEEPTDEPLESWMRHDEGLPALEVSTTQTTHDDATPQAGTVAGRITETVQDVYTETDQHDDPHIETDRRESIEAFATDWVADVTGSGVVLAESIPEDEELPFPFDIFGGLTDSPVQRQQLDIESLHRDWEQSGGLAKVWMSGTDATRGTDIQYHGAVSTDEAPPTIGLGFERGWGGTTIKGVCYAGGYVALYSARHAADGLQFVREELLPYAERWNPDEHEEQTDFDDFGGGA